MHGLLARQLALVLFAGAVGANAAEPQPVGTIIAEHQEGIWLADGTPVIDGAAARDGVEVKLAATVSPAQRQRASIVVVYSIPGVQPYACRGADPCAGGFRITARGPVDDALAKLNATGKLTHPGVLPVLTGGRGIAQEAVSDGVVARVGERITIGPLLTRVEAGSYQAVIARETAGTSPTLTLPLRVTTGPAAVAVAVPGATDGLYTLLLRSADGLDVLSDEALFLAVGADRLAARKTTYDAAVALTRTWSSSSFNADLATLFRRRVLGALAEGD
jgi:hypothetical protein